MEEIAPPPVSSPSPSPRSSAPFLRYIVAILLLILPIGGFVLGQKYELKQADRAELVKVYTPPVTSPTPDPAQPPLVVDSALHTSDCKITSPGWTVRYSDTSADKNSAVCFLTNANGYNAELYLLLNGKPIKKVLEGKIMGRGGSYMDNTNLAFSPSGKYFVFEYTPMDGTTSPRGIYNLDGQFLADISRGHTTWVGNNALLYLQEGNDRPVVYDVETKTTQPSNLPSKLTHFSASPNFKYIVAQTNHTAKPCKDEFMDSTDLVILSYPEGKVIKNLIHTGNLAKWLSGNKLEYLQVTGCDATKTQDEGDSITKTQTVTLP